MLMIKIIILIAYVAAGIILFAVLIGLMSIFPPRNVTPVTPKDFNLEYEEVWFETEDNIKLNGWFIPNKKSDTIIIVCHGYPFDKGNVLGFAPFLHEKYNLFFFDFRAMGTSKGRYTTAGYLEVRDFNAAVDFVKNKGFEKIGAIGFSMGAATIIMAKNPDVKAIVADSAYASLEKMVEQQYKIFSVFKKPFVFVTKLFVRLIGIDISKASPQKAIKEIKVPVLLIHGRKDDQIPVENSILIHNANKETELWIIENANHGEAHYLNEKEYEARVSDFFGKNLK